MADAIRFENVTKYYPRGGNYASLRQDIVDGARRIGARLRGQRLAERGTPALRDMSFEIGEGESVALVGPNGAGKTTALKLISRISYPSSGRVLVRGRVGALIEIQAGIHPELTARENIWLYGRILGMSKADIRTRFDSIVEFAELQKFIDVPVKRYSSGMQLRLGFSIASHLDPEVFVVDEALSVGDAWFQMRCVDRMRKLLGEGRTLVFVSHDLNLVESVCDRAILLRDGAIADEGDAKAVLVRYVESIERRRLSEVISLEAHGTIRVVSAECRDLEGNARDHFEPGEGIEICLSLASETEVVKPHVNLAIVDPSYGMVIQCSMVVDGGAPDLVGPAWSLRCRIDELPLRPRVYEIYCEVSDLHGHVGLLESIPVAALRIEAPPGRGVRAITGASIIPPVIVPYSWTIDDGLSGEDQIRSGSHTGANPWSAADVG